MTRIKKYTLSFFAIVFSIVSIGLFFSIVTLLNLNSRALHELSDSKTNVFNTEFFTKEPVEAIKTNTYIATVIENHPGARPYQTALKDASIVMEWPVEGLATRFMAIFTLDNLPSVFGPIRSLRPYTIQGAMPWTNVFFHAGASPEAYEYVSKDKNLTNINGTGGDYSQYFYRDDAVAPPHNLFIKKDDLIAVLSGVTLKEGQQKESVTMPLTGSAANVVTITSVSNAYKSVFTYHADLNTYSRTNGTSTSFANPESIFIMHMPILGVGEKGRLTLKTTGSGAAAYFANGQYVLGSWARNTVEDEWQFFDIAHNPIPMHMQHSWISVVPDMKWLQIEQ